jgi:nucleotide-binding universal stress UspA family protein
MGPMMGAGREARSIVVGYEGTAQAKDALELARSLAVALDATPMIVTVGPPASLTLGLDAQIQDELDRILAGATGESGPLLRLGVAVDGSTEAESALSVAVALAERTRATLSLMTVAEPPVYGYGAALAAISGDDLLTAETEARQKALDRAVASVPQSVPVSARLVRGDAASALAELTGSLDLLLMGSRGYGPIGRTFLGGTANRVVHAAACPVLVLPRGIDPGAFTAPAGTAEPG